MNKNPSWKIAALALAISAALTGCLKTRDALLESYDLVKVKGAVSGRTYWE